LQNYYQPEIECMPKADMAKLQGERVYGVDLGPCVLQLPDEVFGVLGRAHDDRDRVDPLRVRDYLPARRQMVEPSRRLQQLEGNQQLCLPLVDYGRIDLVPVPDESHDRPATLAHSVDLRNFCVVSLDQQRPAHQLAREQAALAADADYQNIMGPHSYPPL